MGSFDELRKQMEQMNSTIKTMKTMGDNSSERKVDERIYKPKQDSAGNVLADIRFIPYSDFSKPFMAVKHHHFIKLGNKYFVEHCYNNKIDGGTCCICDYWYKELWPKYNVLKEQYGKDSEQCKKFLSNVINNFGQKQEFLSNVFVIKDSLQAEKENGVFIYPFPKTIKEKIDEKMFPEDDDLDPINVFNVVDGRTFRIKASKQGGFGLNYKSSIFLDKSSSLMPEPDQIHEILSNTHDLQAYIDESKKTPEEIETRFKEFMRTNGKFEDFEQTTVKTSSSVKSSEHVVEEVDEIDEISESELDDLFD